MMSRTSQIIAGAATLIVLILGVFLYLKRVDMVSKEIQMNDEIIEKNSDIDVDLDVHRNNADGNVEILYNDDGSIDTSNWKTYRNEKYGFEVRYPKDLNMLDEYKSNEFVDSIFAVHIREDIGGILIKVQDNEFDLNNVVGIHGSKVDEKYIEIKEYSNIKMYSYATGDAGCHGTITHVPMDNRTLTINITDCIDGSSEINLMRNKILESIKLFD